MGIFDNLRANADASIQKKIDEGKLKSEKLFAEYALKDEIFTTGFILIEDFLIITNKRILFANNSIFSKEREFTSIPLTKVTGVSINRSSSILSFGDKITIYASGSGFSFNSGLIAKYIFNAISEVTC